MYPVLTDNVLQSGLSLRLTIFVLFDYLIKVGEPVLEREENLLNRLAVAEAEVSWDYLMSKMADRDRQKLRQQLALAVQTAFPLGDETPTTSFNDGFALIIGVGGNLSAPPKDAARLRDLLTDPSRCAYPPEQVRCLLEGEATAPAIRDSLAWLQKQVAANSQATALIYYSGHGRENPQYHLVPHGYDISNISETAVLGSELTEAIKEIKAQKKLIILDACHAGGLIDVLPMDVASTPVPDDLIKKLSEGTGTVVISSSMPWQKSYARTDSTIFSRALREALAGWGTSRRDGYVYVAEIAMYLSRVVPERAGALKLEQYPVLDISQADNYAIAWYAAGKNQPLPLGESPEIEPPSSGLSGETLIGNQAKLHQYQMTYWQRLQEISPEPYKKSSTDPILQIKIQQAVQTERQLGQYIPSSVWPTPDDQIRWLVDWLDKRFTKLEAHIDGQTDELKAGLRAIYARLPADDTETLERILSELHYQRLEQAEMERTVESVRRVLQQNQITDDELKELMEKVYRQVTSSLSMEEQFELTLPVIPLLLNYKISLSGGVELDALWQEFKDRFLKNT
ncbi:MAG: caspase family protein [Chloroflexi bacterium]|nr:caspase family protein [Chloroflexota bacterium]